MIKTVKSFSMMAILLAGTFSGVFASCQQRADNVSDNIVSKPLTPYVVGQQAADNVSGKVVNKPYILVPFTPSKPYPGLDTSLSDLLTAYESGGDAAAAAYAKGHSLELDDSKVKVIIEVKPGSRAAVVSTLNDIGAKNVMTYVDWISASVPFNQIKSLADNPAIKGIGRPF